MENQFNGKLSKLSDHWTRYVLALSSQPTSDETAQPWNPG